MGLNIITKVVSGILHFIFMVKNHRVLLSLLYIDIALKSLRHNSSLEKVCGISVKYDFLQIDYCTYYLQS